MTPSSSRHERVGAETESSSRRTRSAMSWPPSFLTMALSWPAVSPADANSVLMIVSPWANLPVSFSSNPRRNHGQYGHSQETPKNQYFLAMTTSQVYVKELIIRYNTSVANCKVKV